MTTLPYRSLALAGFIMLALPACASLSAVPQTDASPLMGVDLGPSSRVPRAQLAMAGAGHDAHRDMSDMASGKTRLVHEGGSDAHATGTVNGVDPQKRTINLSHGPISALGWPAMTMDFPVSPAVDINHIKPGSRVDFSLEKDKGGTYQIQSVQPAGGGR
jgi:Cu(I)/Ag(I) efflux system protein CusF